MPAVPARRLVGIPRSLLYYTYYPAWREFLTRLGLRVVVSEPTSRAILDSGVRLTVTEACVPIKVAHGHVQALLEMGVDYVFLPRLICANGRTVYCPKFLGLPDMIASAFEVGSWLLSPRYDARNGPEELQRVALEVAGQVGASHAAAEAAARAAVEAHRHHRAQLSATTRPPVCTPSPALANPGATPDLRLAVVGYPYTVHDPYLNLNLLAKLEQLGVTVLTAEGLTDHDLDHERRRLPKDLFWTFSEEIVLAGYRFMAGPAAADGVIHVTAFGCGPDSVADKLLAMRAVDLGDVPYMSLMIDEHTGEAGLATRLEAFVDMVSRRIQMGAALSETAVALASVAPHQQAPLTEPLQVRRRFARRRRKVSFPYLGTLPPVFAEVLEELGNEVVLPPRPSRLTLSLGTAMSPEFACLPFKILLGTYLEAIEQGADAIVASGGVGPCRAGLYTMLHEMMLRRAGHDVEILTLEPPRLDLRDFAGKFSALNAARLSPWRIAGLLNRAWRKVKALDELERLSHHTRPREQVAGATTKAWRTAQELVFAAKTATAIGNAAAQARELLNSVPRRPDAAPLRVGIVGEIYVVVEPSANLELEEELGHMGVEPVRSIYMSGWTRESNLLGTPGKGKAVRADQAARPYLAEMIGGHGQESVGNAVLFGQSGFDGVIQLAPFSCIPEIVAKSVLERVNRELSLPVLSISLDEQTGRVGLFTRLEAFVDLMARKQEISGSPKPEAQEQRR